MIKLLYPKLLIISVFCFSGTVSAHIIPTTTAADITKKETVKKDTSSEEKASFKFGVDFISNNVFMGRTSPTATPTFAPEVRYTFKPGFYLSSTLDYLPNNKTSKLDGGDIGAGWDFDITDNLSGGASFTKMFYNVNSNQIGSAVSSVFNANLDYNIADIISPTVSIDYNSNKTGISDDFFFNFGLAHDFIAAKLFAAKDFILISPTVQGSIGTQNFYDAFITKKVFKSAKRTAAQDALITAFETNLNKSKLLDYEFSLPVVYKSGHFIFQFTPTYAIVENGFKPAAAKTLGLSNASSVFYFTTGVSWKF